MGKRFLGFYSFLLMIYGASVLNAMPLRILSAMDRYYPAQAFSRISEYFTGIEDTGGDTILRTSECGREGIYLVIGLNKFVSQLGEGVVLRFRYVVCDSNEEKEKVFNLSCGCGYSPWIFIGITGPDFHGKPQYLVAWSVEIQTSQECVVRNSFLWQTNKCKIVSFENQ